VNFLPLFTFLWFLFATVNNNENMVDKILWLWFRVSLIYTNNCPTRSNTKHSILKVHSTCFGCQTHPYYQEYTKM